MDVEVNFDSLFQSLKLDEIWLQPKPWESVPSESGQPSSVSSFPACSSPPRHSIYDTSSVSEASLVRLIMNALQGVQSALVSIEKLSALFCSDPADRSVHRFPTIWNRSLSTHALGKMLKSIGFTGTLVLLLYRFVEHFTGFNGTFVAHTQVCSDPEGAQNPENNNFLEHSSCSLVNQAFCVAVRKVLSAYICALDTVNSSAHSRRSVNNNNFLSNASLRLGNIRSSVHTEITVLEVYLHTKELRTQIETLGNLCGVYVVALCFSEMSMDNLVTKASVELCNFPQGGQLLSYLHDQLQVADPVHSTLLKFLFLQALEPYCGFIRSWIYEGKLSDPHNEFVLQYDQSPSDDNSGTDSVSPLMSLKVRDGVSVPSFLKEVTIPILRAGQQFQVVMKLLEFCKHVSYGSHAFEDILPGCRNDLLSNICSYSTPLSFDKEKIQATMLLRKNFYRGMLEKLEYGIRDLDIKFEQVVLHDAASIYADNSKGGIDSQLSLIADESFFSPSAEKRDSNEASENEGSEEESFVEFEHLESSECSSVEGFEALEVGQSADIGDRSHGIEQSYLSALCISRGIFGGNLLKQIPLTEKLKAKQSGSASHSKGSSKHFSSTGEEGSLTDSTVASESPVVLSGSWVSKVDYAGHHPGLGWPVGGLLENPFRIDKERGATNFDLAERALHISTLNIQKSDNSMSSVPDSRNHCLPEYFSSSDISKGDDFSSRTNRLPTSYLSHSCYINFLSNVLSMNPMLTRNAFLNKGSEPELKDALRVSTSFPYFNFSSTQDPLNIYIGGSPSCPEHQSDNSDEPTSAVHHVDCIDERQHDPGSMSIRKDDMAAFESSLPTKDNNAGPALNDVRGGSSWESLLFSSTITTNENCDDFSHSTASFGVPLAFIVDKCLSQEILLQYHYMSMLTMKMLEVGFNLEQHLLALRRYFFMEVADWADLFVASLWHHKWYFMEANQKVPEIQGLLEVSIQRSCCEGDIHKSRLYVYLKESTVASFSPVSEGVCCFNFIGLGYRVDWPISMVLTSNALKVYSEIFSFLIRVKLAILALSDVWCSLKDFWPLIIQGGKDYRLEWNAFNSLIKLRHQVSHFISTLQQYVLSQLSDVCWGRFLHSLKHQVRDMMDLEAMHMAYLSDSLHICFLVDEAQSISKIIASNLQCALDLRSCLVKETANVKLENGGSRGNLWQINTSQVLSVKQKFDNNMKELHLCYLKSPKHAEFGLSRFWNHLNCNDYYSDLFGNQMVHYGFPVNDLSEDNLIST